MPVEYLWVEICHPDHLTQVMSHICHTIHVLSRHQWQLHLLLPGWRSRHCIWSMYRVHLSALCTAVYFGTVDADDIWGGTLPSASSMSGRVADPDAQPSPLWRFLSASSHSAEVVVGSWIKSNRRIPRSVSKSQPISSPLFGEGQQRREAQLHYCLSVYR